MECKTGILKAARIVASYAALMGASCGGGERVRLERPLPFHVAIVPVDPKEDDALSIETEASVSEDDPTLVLDRESVTLAISEILAKQGFAEVSVLQYPIDASAFMTLGQDEQDQRWQEMAREHHADLILKTTLVYEPNISGKTNEKFWLNLPLFLLGGPFCYFIDDRTYDAKAQLDAQFYDAFRESDLLGEECAVLPQSIQVAFDGAQLDFRERTGRNAGAYALSLLVPAGLLSRESDRIAGKVRAEAMESLRGDLLEKVASQQDQFLNGDRLGKIALDKSAAVTRNGNGSVKVSIPIKSNGSNLKRATILARGQALAELDLASLPVRDGWTVIEKDVAVPAGVDRLQLLVENEVPRARTFTFRVL